MEKTGAYIAIKRKEKGMTQKDLAEKVGLTDKAVSKWERAKSVPDPAVLPDLCRALNISMNEFLSGEDISEPQYSDRAEENMKFLLEENKKQIKDTRLVVGGIAVVLVLLFIGVYGIMLLPGGGVASFIDLPSLLAICGGTGLVFIISGYLYDLIELVKIIFLKENFTNEQFIRSTNGVKYLFILNILVGVLISLMEIVLTMSGTEKSDVAPLIALSLLPLFYGTIFGIIWFILWIRLKQREDNKDGEQYSVVDKDTEEEDK